MKRILPVMFLSLALVFFAGCASMDKGAVSQIKEVAIVSVYADKNVDMQDFGGLAAAVSALAQNEAFNLQPIVLKFRDDLISKYAGAFGFKVMDEQTVLASPEYQALKAKVVIDMTKLVYELPQGYIAINPLDKKKALAVADAFPNVQGFMYGTMSFRLVKQFEIAGFGTAKMQAYLNIYVKDRNGKTVVYKYTFADSDDSIKFALGGVFDAAKIQPLCVQAADKAAVKFEEWVKKKMATPAK
jgi:hypothetical protein